MANDYYEFVNKEFLDNNHLSYDDYIYNTFTMAQDESNKVRDAIIKDVVNGSINILRKYLKVSSDQIINVGSRGFVTNPLVVNI